MSFDLFLTAFRNGETAVADAVAARAVLARFQHDYDSEFGAYKVRFDDGSQLELFASGLDGGAEPFEGGMFALRELSEPIGAFIFDFSRSAGCAIFPAMEPPSVLLPSPDLASHLPADVNEDYRRIPITNGAELLTALRG